jgi:hypothetical protein
MRATQISTGKKGVITLSLAFWEYVVFEDGTDEWVRIEDLNLGEPVPTL